MSEYCHFDPKLTGQAFAEASEKEQADFLNEFGRWLQIVCRRSMLGADTQICRFVDHIDGNGAWLIDAIKGHLDYRREIEEQKKRLTPRGDA